MEFRLLGAVEVLEDGRPRPLGGRRQRAVLVHLLLARGGAVSRDQLIAEVWGVDAPGAVRASVHTYVSRLRSVLGPARLETRSAGYVLLVDDDEVDAWRFEHVLASAQALAEHDPAAAAGCFASALALWRGPALGDLADEPNLRATATRLEGLRDRAVQGRVAARLACGDHLAVVPELAALVHRSPLREDLWAQYVLALYRCGRQGEALDAWERARRLLDDELGVEPGPALRRLHDQVLRQDPLLELPGPDLHGYRLEEVLGRGTSCVVHRAVQPVSGQEVALKLLHRSVADDPELVAGFAAAAQAAAALDHPCVVPLIDCWRAPGVAVLVLRLLRGGTLADLVTRDPPDVSELLPPLEQVAAGLDACARQGVVHVAIRADDVLLDERGRAHVSPFVLGSQVVHRRSVPGEVTTAGTGPGDGSAHVRALAGLLRDVLAAPARRSDPSSPALDELRALAEQTAADGGFVDAAALVAAVRQVLGAAEHVPTASRSVGTRNPYKGLRAFSEADAADFAGRSALVAQLAARLAAPPTGEGLRFLAVVGPSGSGKSSLVRAGLLPVLRAGAVPDVDRWYVVDVVPGEAPFAELATALRRVAVDPVPPPVAEELRADPCALLSAVGSLLPPDETDRDERSEVLLLVDQFEELFTLVGEQERRAFVDALVVAVTTPTSRLRVVVTLRADFYDRPLWHPPLAELVRAGTEVLVPLTAEELEQAVVEPAERAGLRVEPALLARVVADVADAPAALPMLQFALTELAERAHDGVLSVAGYREVGGVAGALVRRADGVHAGFAPAQQAVARQVLLQLVQPGEAAGDARRRVVVDELVRRTDDAATAREVVQALGEARLLAFDRDPATRAPTVEVAHEALLREWDLLRGWVDAARDDLRTERRLTAAAREWDETGRDASFLAAGSRLEAVEQWSARWAASTGWSPSALEHDFLEQSLQARDAAAEAERLRRARERALERRSVQRLRAIAAVLAVAVLAASALTAFGFSQRNRAERESVVAEARALAAASVASLDVDPERAVLLALEAVRRTEDGPVLPEAQEALHRAVVAQRVLLTLPGAGGAVAWSSRGLIATEGPPGSNVVQARDGTTGEVVRVFPRHEADVNQLAFSPDGTRLASTDDAGAVRLWDVDTGELLWTTARTGQVWGPSFSSDGRRFAAAWQDEGVVLVLDTVTGTVVRPLRSVGLPRATGLTPDGAAVVIGGEPVDGAVVHAVASGDRLLHLAPGGPAASAVDVSPDGRWVATSGADLQARLWSLPDGVPGPVLSASAPIADVDWSADSSRIVLGSTDGVARVFEVDAAGAREALRLSSSVLRGITGVTLSPEGRRLLVGDALTSTAQVWDVSASGSREWATVQAPRLAMLGADFTADGAQVAASATEGRLAFLRASDGTVLRWTPPHHTAVATVRTSPDGALVAGTVDASLRMWDARSGVQVFAAPVPVLPVQVVWRPDGALLAVVSEQGRLVFVDRRGRAVPGPAGTPDRRITSAAYSPDGALLLVAVVPPDDGTGSPEVQVRDSRTGELRHQWRAEAQVLAVAPDGRTVVTTEPDGDVVLRDVRTGGVRRTLVGHAGRVWDATWTPDGARLATAGSDSTVRLWDVSEQDLTGRDPAQRPLSLVLRGHDRTVYSVRAAPDGRRLVTTSGDGTVRIWALRLDDLVQLATQRLTRGLTDDECQRFLQRRSCRWTAGDQAVQDLSSRGKRSSSAGADRRRRSTAGQGGPRRKASAMSVLSRSSQRHTSSTTPTAKTPAGIPAQPQPAGQRGATRPAVRSAEETSSRRRRAALVLVGLVAVLAIAIGTAVAMLTSDGDEGGTLAPGVLTNAQETEQLRDEAALRRGGVQPGPAADAPAAPASQGGVFVG